LDFSRRIYNRRLLIRARGLAGVPTATVPAPAAVEPLAAGDEAAAVSAEVAEGQETPPTLAVEAVRAEAPAPLTGQEATEPQTTASQESQQPPAGPTAPLAAPLDDSEADLPAQAPDASSTEPQTPASEEEE